MGLMRFTEPDIRNLKELCRNFSGLKWVQSAGGNVSLKNNGLMAVKQSGRRLRDYNDSDFLCVLDLEGLRSSLKQGNYSRQSIDRHLICGRQPSIETSMHAVLKQTYVLHLHPPQIIAMMASSWNEMKSLLIHDLDISPYSFLPYLSPGKELATALVQNPHNNDNRATKFYFLANHGLIIADDNPKRLADKLRCLEQTILPMASCTADYKFSPCCIELDRFKTGDHWKIASAWITKVIKTPKLLEKVLFAWNATPDHALILGDEPKLISNRGDLSLLVDSAYICIEAPAIFLPTSRNPIDYIEMLYALCIIIQFNLSEPNAIVPKNEATAITKRADELERMATINRS